MDDPGYVSFSHEYGKVSLDTQFFLTVTYMINHYSMILRPFRYYILGRWLCPKRSITVLRILVSLVFLCLDQERQIW